MPCLVLLATSRPLAGPLTRFLSGAPSHPCSLPPSQRPFQNVICEGVEEGLKGMKPGAKRKASVFAGTSEGVAAAKKAALETLPADVVTSVNAGSIDRFMQEAMMTSDTKAFCMLFSDKP